MAYLISLLAASGCLAAVDRRFVLFFWREPRAAAAAVGIGTAFFLAWDFAAIGAGIFERGESPLMTGILLAPELPLEEPFFLAFFCYAAMVLFTVAERLLRLLRLLRLSPRRRDAGGASADRRGRAGGPMGSPAGARSDLPSGRTSR
ncbi:lycopene cyclase domain-containing protein [Sinomonas albida]|uniref:lycopene cyclase domain-containing protein n=1 Tax=Sinomonas albida TaxID=369942 RepID=UPI00301A6F0D